MNRKYEQRRRAESAADTRRRIVEATVDLHRTVGPRLTTVAEVARRAGVERLTVYKHFPEEEAMVRACQGHWLGQHPRPDIERWAEIADPDKRLRAALAQMYAWYEETEPMTENVVRDAPTLQSFAAIVQGWQRGAQRSVEILSAGRDIAADARLRFAATVSAALGFYTWRTLVRQAGLTAEAAIDLVCDWVSAAAKG